MTDSKNILMRDHKHIWHPCSQMKDYESWKPLEVICAKNSHIELSDGRKIIDAISSWWCKSLGHNHERLKIALHQQLEKFEHVIFANTTHETIVALSEKLSKLTRNLDKVFYAGDGSSAVDIALKMSLHARKIMGEDKRNLFAALENGYHGESIGALSVSDLGMYKAPYSDLFFPVQFLAPIPYVHSTQDELWQKAEKHWHAVQQQLDPIKDHLTAIILEPIVQGAGGMKIYSQDFLKRLHTYAKKHHIHLIADEIMTGLGRTGKMLACEHANIEPDFLCLSKGLTSGFLPMSAVLTSSSIYDLFYDDYGSGKSFLHSHTYSGNALGASVALEVLTLFEEENFCDQANHIGNLMLTSMQEIAHNTQLLENVRGIGAIVAADMINPQQKRLSLEIGRKSTELGALLRPLGNTIYWLPPLTIDDASLFQLKEITQQVLLEVVK